MLQVLPILFLVLTFSCFLLLSRLPISFYLKLFGKEMSTKEKILDWILIVVCVCLSVVGTVFAFLPKHLLGAE